MAAFFLSKELVDKTISGVHENMAIKVMLDAVEQYHIRILFAQHDPKPFHDALLKDCPYVALIGDDDPAKGPEGFHPESLQELIRNIGYAVIMSGTPNVDLYRLMSLIPSFLRINALIVETLPEQERAWSDFIRSENPEMHLMIHSPVSKKTGCI